MKKILLIFGLLLVIFFTFGYGLPYILIKFPQLTPQLKRQNIHQQSNMRIDIQDKPIPHIIRDSYEDWLTVNDWVCHSGKCAKIGLSVDMRNKNMVTVYADKKEIVRVTKKEPENDKDTYFTAILINNDGTEVAVIPYTVCYKRQPEGNWISGACNIEDEKIENNDLWLSFALGGLGSMDSNNINKEGFGMEVITFPKYKENKLKSLFKIPDQVPWELSIAADNEKVIGLVDYITIQKSNVVGKTSSL